MMPDLKVAIRCDGTTTLGLGHVAECLALARSLTRQARCEIVFFMQRDTPGPALVREAGFPCAALEPAAMDDELQQLAERLVAWVPDLLIVDLPDRPRAYYQRLKALAPQVVAIFDDGQDHGGVAHHVVDYAVDQRATSPADDGTRYWLGPQFALLEESFREERLTVRTVPEVCRRLLVTQGGSDPFRLTVKILRALALLRVTQEVVVVVGAAASPGLQPDVESLVPTLPYRCRVEHAVPPARLRALMRETDLAITAAGNTLYELCAMGVPALVIGHHERHQAVAAAFERHGAVRTGGIGTAVSMEQMAQAIRGVLDDAQARRTLSRQGLSLVDGLGCARVASALIAGVAARCASS